jgi:ferredoxin--NADP+ reductase
VERSITIDPQGCIDCGACVPACPVSAIYPEDQLPPAEARFVEVNARYFTSRSAARALISW